MDAERLAAASAWRVRQENGFSVADRRRFDLWITDPENADAYTQVATAWNAFDAPAEVEFGRLRGDARRRALRRRQRGNVARIAATVVLALGGGGIYAATHGGGQVYDNPGQNPTEVVLSDGSHLTLDARSTVKVRYVGKLRRFELRRGQAAFQVAHDPARPFRVRVNDVTVTALGTTFNIDRWDSGTTITLMDGAVKVDRESWIGSPAGEALLAPGEQVTVADGRFSEVEPASTETITAWRLGTLVFNDVTLDQALASVNRHGGQPVRLADPRLGKLRISGVFQAGETDGFFKSVAQLHGLRATAGPDGITLQARE